jgi:DNA-directed RNA polymerase subunit RPC12/RpoP
MIRMAIQVVLIDEAEDRRDVHEIARIDRAGLCAEALGLSLAEGKESSGGIQRILAGAQVNEWQEANRICPECGRRRSLKGRHPILFRTPFCTLRLDSERVRSCPCAGKPKRLSISPLAALLSERVSPELLYLETKFASLVSYGMTVRPMDEVLPLDRPIRPERVRRDLFRVAKAHEAELASVPISLAEPSPGSNQAPPDGPFFVGMDGGYVRGRDKNWFEAVAGKSVLSFHRDGRVPDPSGRCFAFVQTVDTRPRARLVDTLRQQSIQPGQPVVFMSDGADTLRRLQQNIAPEVEHVLDCWGGRPHGIECQTWVVTNQDRSRPCPRLPALGSTRPRLSSPCTASTKVVRRSCEPIFAARRWSPSSKSFPPPRSQWKHAAVPTTGLGNSAPSVTMFA